MDNELKLSIDSKQVEKQRKKEERYWNTMISRKEAKNMVEETLEANLQGTLEKLQALYVQIRAVQEILIKTNVTTVDELNNKAKEIIEELFADDIDEEQKRG